MPLFSLLSIQFHLFASKFLIMADIYLTPFNSQDWHNHIHQRCQSIYYNPPHNVIIDIMWDDAYNCPLIQTNNTFYHVKSYNHLNTSITLRDCFYAILYQNKFFEITYPTPSIHNIHNILDTPVIDSIICQLQIHDTPHFTPLHQITPQIETDTTSHISNLQSV